MANVQRDDQFLLLQLYPVFDAPLFNQRLALPEGTG
jgi:hypothetical protein